MNPWRGLKDLPRNMWIIFFATLINRTGTMVLPFLAVYLTIRRGESADQAGLVIAFYGLGALLTSPLVGKLSDRIGAKLLMQISLISSGFILFIYSFISSYYLIICLTFTWSIISEAFRPANLSLISEVVPSKQRRPAFSLNRLAINLGMSIGPVAAGFLMLINFSIIFYVDGLTSILAGLFLIYAPWLSGENISTAEQGGDIPNNKELIFALKDRNMIYFLIALLPVVMVYFQHLAAMPLFLVKDLNFQTSTLGILFAINTLLVILVEVPLNNFLIKWNDKILLIIGSILAAIGFGLMTFAKDTIFIALTIVIWTFGEMILFPASSNHISNIAPVEKRGEYMGFFQMNFSLAFTLGPWLGTVVFHNFGSQILWICTFIFGMVSAALMFKIKPQIETA